MRYLPVNLDVAGRRVLVVGGGRVAARKIKALRDCGAEVTVVSPRFCSGVARMKGVRRIRRSYRRTDLRGAALVVSAAGPQTVNRRVWEDACAAGVPVNVVDQPALCTFTMPAVLKRGDLVITVSTGGGSPALSARVRELLAEVIGPEFGKHLGLLKAMREAVKASGLPSGKRGALLKAMASDAVRERLRREGVAAARRHLEELLARAAGRRPRSAPAGREGQAGKPS